jgi:hypothetical protein
MALNNPQLVDFCNDELRQIADRFVALQIRVDSAYSTYLARNLGTIINDGGSTNPVLDGSATDGRTIATGGDVYNLVTMMQDFQTFMTQGRVDVLYKWQVNGNRSN